VGRRWVRSRYGWGSTRWSSWRCWRRWVAWRCCWWVSRLRRRRPDDEPEWLPRLLEGRTCGPIFCTDRAAPTRTPTLDVCPVTGRARLSYRRAAELSTTATRPLSGRWVGVASASPQRAHPRGRGRHQYPLLLARSRHASVQSLERYARPGPEAVARAWRRPRAGRAAPTASLTNEGATDVRRPGPAQTSGPARTPPSLPGCGRVDAADAAVAEALVRPSRAAVQAALEHPDETVPAGPGRSGPRSGCAIAAPQNGRRGGEQDGRGAGGR
jgi:hypothetical protein